VSLSYIAYMQEYPVLPLGIQLLEFLPLYALLLVQAARQYHRSARREPAAVVFSP